MLALVAAQGDPAGLDDPGGLRALVGWAAQRLGAPHLTGPTLAAMQLAGLDPTSVRQDFSWECHHDGSGLVDTCIFLPAPAPAATLAAHEFDLAGGNPRLAGVFRDQLTEARELQAWGQPEQVARMSGRGGVLRVILGVTTAMGLEQLCEQLRAAGTRAATLDGLAGAAPLLTGPTTLRLAIDIQPGTWALGPRIGLEVFLDPAVFLVDPPLAALSVPAAQVADMIGLAQAVPAGRRLSRTLPQLPGVRLPDVCQGIGFSHFKLTWTEAANGSAGPTLKSYFLVSSGPAASAVQLRDEAVLRASPTWPERLHWASNQLPLRKPTPGELAELQQWRQAVDPHADQSAWLTRLECDGLDEGRAIVALSERARQPVRHTPTWWPWYRVVVAAVAAGSTPGHAGAQPPAQATQSVPFAHLLWPAAVAAWQRFAQENPELAAGVAPQARQDLQLALLSRLSTVATPTLLHLMWEPVTYGKRLLAALGVRSEPPSGAAPATGRYQELCAQLTADAMAAALQRYPVLGGLLGQAAQAWHEALAEMLTRLARDRGALSDALGIPAGLPVTAVMMAAGDTHNGGRTVAILDFAGTRLVYKPRSVDLERLYHDVVLALVEQPGQRPLRAGRTVARSDLAGPYGYMEFVSASPSRDRAQLATFYRNAGRTLAVLHALSATDCHHENLIATGEHLVLIDAETLLCGPGDGPARVAGGEPDGLELTGPTQPANVLRIGLLPTWLWLDGQRRAVDISALGVSPQWRSGGPALRAINTDAMIRGPIESPADPEASHPTDPKVETGTDRLQAHLADFVAGFTDAYEQLSAGANNWLGQVVDSCAPTTRRAVLRPTYVYASLLGSSLEPQALTSPAARGLVLERLTRAHLDSPDHPSWPIVGAEQQALTRLDIPYFEVALAGGATSWPGGSLPGWPPATPGWSARADLDRLTRPDRDLQVRLIHSAVAVSALRLGPSAQDSKPSIRPDPPSPAAAALASMTQVTAAAIPAPDRTSAAELDWLGAVMLPDGVRANLAGIGPGLYDGRMGLAIALYEWGATGAGGHRQGPQAQAAHQIAAAALAPVLRALAGLSAQGATRLVTALGLGMAGVGGLLRGLGLLRARGHLTEQATSDAEQALLAGLSPGAIAAARTLDHIGGVAGLIGPLVALAGPRMADGGAAELIHASAQALVAGQDPSTGGWWTLPGAAPLTGLAHGASGISLALARAGAALGAPEYIDAALRGLQYEESTFDRDVGNWPDFRETGNQSASKPVGFMMGWCAGAPGIALARMALLELLPNHPEASQWRNQLRTAARTTADAPLLTRDHLCCGNLGRVVVLRQLTRSQPDPRLDRAAAQIESAVLGRPGQVIPASVLGPTTSGVPMPGLMTGLPGIALALLDLECDWVPQLLI